MRGHASITIRQLDPTVKRKLKARAAAHGRSMEAEAREILRTTLAAPEKENAAEFVTRIRQRAAALGGIDLELPPRGPARPLPGFDGP